MCSLPLPRDTRRALKAVDTPSNFGLAFHRYLDHPGANPQNWKGTDTEEEQWKRLEEQARKIFDRGGKRSTQAALDQQHVRYDHMLEQRQQRWETGAGQRLEANVAWRLLIGLSAPSVLNNGITLHPLFGFPYLPASGVKGLLRHFRLTRIAEQVGVRPLSPRHIAEREQQRTPWHQLDDLLRMPEPETDAEQDQMQDDFEHLRADMEAVMERLRTDRRKDEGQEDAQPDDDLFGGVTCTLGDLRKHADDYRDAFGSPDQRGSVHFFDALPKKLIVEGKSLLERDILTPHNKEYHTEGKPPADYHDPVPVQMLAVRRGVSFVFRMTCPDERLLREVRDWLERAVTFWGAGAKTRAGYGELIVEESDAA